MIFDPVYLLFVLPGLGLSLRASARVKSAFKKYSNVHTARGFTGAEAAQALLRGAGITDVRIVRSQGVLSDHCNPMNKTLALSEAVFGSDSIAAVGVATHEAGHALQHAVDLAVFSVALRPARLAPLVPCPKGTLAMARTGR